MSDFKKEVMDLVGKAKGVVADDAALPQIGGKKKHSSKKGKKSMKGGAGCGADVSMEGGAKKKHSSKKHGSKKHSSKKQKGGVNPYMAASQKIRAILKRMGITGGVPVVKTINHYLKKKGDEDWETAGKNAIKAVESAGKDEVQKVFKRYGGTI